MPIDDFVLQYNKLQNRDVEQKTWEIWLVLRPYMDKNNFISYEEMLTTAKQQEIKPELLNQPVNGVYIDQAFI